MAPIQPVDATGQQINVRNCSSCDAPHEGMAVHDYRNRNSLWTHWYACPTTGDPVPLCLVSMDFQDGAQGIEVNDEILRDIIDAQITKAYSICIFCIRDGHIHLRRINHVFPTSQLSEMPALLARNIEEEIGPPQPAEMPVAEAPQPLLDLFEPQPAGGDNDGK